MYRKSERVVAAATKGRSDKRMKTKRVQRLKRGRRRSWLDARSVLKTSVLVLRCVQPSSFNAGEPGFKPHPLDPGGAVQEETVIGNTNGSRFYVTYMLVL